MDNPRCRTSFRGKPDEVPILRDHYRVRVCGGIEDSDIKRVLKPQVPRRPGGTVGECIPNPPGDGGGEVDIEPELDHATAYWLANRWLA